MSANDANALVPVGKKAMERGIKVISFDSAIAPEGRLVHLSASSTPLIGAKQVQMIGETLNYEGEVAILSAASTMTNQNSWIEAMKEEWKDPNTPSMKLVATVYGDDQDDKSYREMQAPGEGLPEPQGRHLADDDRHPLRRQGDHGRGLVGKVYITGLGLPSEMLDGRRSGACDSFAIWNPVDYGYSATMIMAASWAAPTPAEGATLSMGKQGRDQGRPDGEATMGEPFIFDKANVAEFAKIF